MHGPNSGTVRSSGAMKVIGKVNAGNGYSGRTAGQRNADGRAGTVLARRLPKKEGIPIAMTTSVQRRALRLLADAQHGRTVANMLAHGFTNALLDRLARDGLATIQPGTIRTGTRRITVIWVVITEAGQQALADKRSVR